MNFKLTILGLFLSFSWLTVSAQEETSNWDLGGDASLTFFQSSFSNWTDGGGEATTTIGALGNLFAKYKEGRTSWDNIGLLQYQIQKVGQDADFLKAVDRLELLSVAGYNVSAEDNSNWSYSFLASLKTQLTATEDADGNLQSSFFAPAEILLAPGMKYSKGDKKTKANLLINFSPATAKFIVVGDQTLADAGTFTSEPATFDAAGNKLTDGATLRTEFGASLVGNYRLNVLETDNIKLTWQTNLELFSNYLENPENVDVKWSNLVTANLFKYFTVSLATDLRYDDNVAVPLDRNGDGEVDGTGPRTRFAQTFGVGIGYKF